MTETKIRARRIAGEGWVTPIGAWTYASVSTITVPSGAASLYQVGDRLRFKQGGGYKYYTLATVADTLLTVDVSTDYTVANSAITDIAISRALRPFGFPEYFNWSPTASGYAVGNGTLIARFMRYGGEIGFVFVFTLGGTSSISGDFNFTLPTTPSASFEGFTDFTDSGSAGYKGFGVGGGSVFYCRAVNVAGTYPTNSTTLSNIVPFTWAMNDVLRASGRYFV